MLNREKVIETIKQLPANFSIDEVIDRIILLDKIETGLKQSEKNQVISDDELDNKLPKWLTNPNYLIKTIFFINLFSSDIISNR